jgi:hypothetical protein
MPDPEPDILLADTGPLVFVLADDRGPFDLSVAALSAVVLGPKPSLAPRVGVPVPTLGARPGHVELARGAWLVAGWLGVQIVGQWGPSDTKQFPSAGPRWLLVA